MDTSAFSTERLLRLAFQNELISDYRMTPYEIEVMRADGTVALDPEEARFYLRGLIEGYSLAAGRIAPQFGAPNAAYAA